MPFYPNTDKVPQYLTYTEKNVDTDSFYWNCRLVAALADAQYGTCRIHIERYQIKAMAEAHRILNETDRKVKELVSAYAKAAQSGTKKADQNDWLAAGSRALWNLIGDASKVAELQKLIDDANEALAAMLKEATADVLGKVLKETSDHMKNSYARSDA